MTIIEGSLRIKSSLALFLFCSNSYVLSLRINNFLLNAKIIDDTYSFNYC